jgi:hypothetical protein
MGGREAYALIAVAVHLSEESKNVGALLSQRLPRGTTGW